MISNIPNQDPYGVELGFSDYEVFQTAQMIKEREAHEATVRSLRKWAAEIHVQREATGGSVRVIGAAEVVVVPVSAE